MIVIRNADVPGIIGRVGMVLGNAGLNIDDMDVGRTEEGVAAAMVIATSGPVPRDVQAQLRSTEGINSVYALDLK